MTKNQEKLLKLLKDENSIYDLSKEMNITPKQLYHRILLLIESGYIIERKDYIDGEITFSLSNKLKYPIKSILSSSDQYTIKVAAISDLHLGNCQQNLKAIDAFIEYCIKKNINIVFNTGDFFQGLLNSTQLGYDCILDSSYEEQFDKYINTYPFDNSITNYLVLGNHDMSYLNVNIDVLNKINKKRYDIVGLGYDNSIIQIKNEKITLSHNGANPSNNRILLQGHSHEAKQSLTCGNLKINIPTLSNVAPSQLPVVMPQFCTINFTFDITGYVHCIKVNNYIILENKIVKTNEFNTYFNNPHNKNNKYKIANLEDSPKVKSLKKNI